MKKIRLPWVLLFLVILLIGSIPLISCEPAIRLTINNNTNITLDVLVSFNSNAVYPYEIQDLDHGKSIKYVFEHDPWAGTRFIYVAALDSEGYLAYYRRYTDDELEKIGKIIITNEPAWHQDTYWNDLWGKPPWKTRVTSE
jgi:hypothetical protein